MVHLRAISRPLIQGWFLWLIVTFGFIELTSIIKLIVPGFHSPTFSQTYVILWCISAVSSPVSSFLIALWATLLAWHDMHQGMDRENSVRTLSFDKWLLYRGVWVIVLIILGVVVMLGLLPILSPIRIINEPTHIHLGTGAVWILSLMVWIIFQFLIGSCVAILTHSMLGGSLLGVMSSFGISALATSSYAIFTPGVVIWSWVVRGVTQITASYPQIRILFTWTNPTGHTPNVAEWVSGCFITILIISLLYVITRAKFGSRAVNAHF